MVEPSNARFLRALAHYRFHDTIPVDLTRLYDDFDVRVQPLSRSVLGWGWFIGQHRVIGINQRLNSYERRMLVCHEACHYWLGHTSAFVTCRLGPWWTTRTELQAQLCASITLVPMPTLVEVATKGATLSEMEDIFEVPSELLTIRLSMLETLRERIPAVIAPAWKRGELALIGGDKVRGGGNL